MIAVAATNTKDRLAAFSNYGKRIVDLAASGESIVSTWLHGGHRAWSGTSMATPFASATAAMLRAQTFAEAPRIRALVISTSDRQSSLRNRVASGGRLNAARGAEGGMNPERMIERVARHAQACGMGALAGKASGWRVRTARISIQIGLLRRVGGSSPCVPVDTGTAW